MTLKHLQIFTEVYRAANVTRAADNLYMTQPAVTRAIKELENFYGTPLFERLNRGVSPTEAGKILYSKALNILEGMEQLNSTLRDWDNLGVIRLGATIALGNTLLPEIVEKLRHTHPRLQVKAYVENAEKLHKRILHNEVDICFVEGLLQDRNLIMKPFSRDRMVLVVPNDEEWADVSEISMEELAEKPLCLRQQGSISRRYAEEAFYSRGLVPNIVSESESTQSILRFVSHGLGVSLLPEDMVQRELKDGLVKEVSLGETKLVRTNYIVWHKDKNLSKTMEEIISWKL